MLPMNSRNKFIRTIPPAFLDVNAVAQYLNCSPQHVYRLSDAGRMPRPVRLGSLVRWSKCLLQRWIAAGCPPDSNGNSEGRTHIHIAHEDAAGADS